MHTAGSDLLGFAGERRFATILADPPWQFTNKTGKIAPEHRRLSRYSTLKLEDIKALPVAQIAAQPSHLYLWCPNALLPEGLAVMKAWGFAYLAADDPNRFHAVFSPDSWSAGTRRCS